MTETFAVSPFGGRGMAHAQISAQRAIARAASGARTRSQSGDIKAVDKWKLIRAVTEARNHLELSDRTICVLEALLSFLPERELKASSRLIVFPSNAELSVRARGMAPATLRRHLASLVSAGLVMRRDSANGKRYARRNEEGEVEQAFGFDLTQLVLRADEIFAQAASARRALAELKALRGEITIHLRDMRAMLDVIGEEGCEGAAELEEAFAALGGRLGRRTSKEALQERLCRLVELRLRMEARLGFPAYENEPGAELSPTHEAAADLAPERAAEEPVAPISSAKDDEGPTAGENRADSPKVSANVRQNERHKKKPESESSLKERNNFGGAGACHQPHTPRVDSCQREIRLSEPRPCAQKNSPTLSSVLKSCQQIADYAPAGISSWQDLAKAADIVRRMLGVSDHGWFAACRAMGEAGAAVAMAVILQRAEHIASPGGYLRSLTAKAQRAALDLTMLLQQEDARRMKARAC